MNNEEEEKERISERIRYFEQAIIRLENKFKDLENKEWWE